MWTRTAIDSLDELNSDLRGPVLQNKQYLLECVKGIEKGNVYLEGAVWDSANEVLTVHGMYDHATKVLNYHMDKDGVVLRWEYADNGFKDLAAYYAGKWYLPQSGATNYGVFVRCNKLYFIEWYLQDYKIVVREADSLRDVIELQCKKNVKDIVVPEKRVFKDGRVFQTSVDSCNHVWDRDSEISVTFYEDMKCITITDAYYTSECRRIVEVDL